VWGAGGILLKLVDQATVKHTVSCVLKVHPGIQNRTDSLFYCRQRFR
jgi:hypothetical protein